MQYVQLCSFVHFRNDAAGSLGLAIAGYYPLHIHNLRTFLHEILIFARTFAALLLAVLDMR